MRDKGIEDKEEAMPVATRYSHLTLATKYFLLRRRCGRKLVPNQ